MNARRKPKLLGLSISMALIGIAVVANFLPEGIRVAMCLPMLVWCISFFSKQLDGEL